MTICLVAAELLHAERWTQI